MSPKEVEHLGQKEKETRYVSKGAGP